MQIDAKLPKEKRIEIAAEEIFSKFGYEKEPWMASLLWRMLARELFINILAIRSSFFTN